MTTNKPVAKILKAIQEAREMGIDIVRTPMFDWTDLGENRSKPRACDATGAVLIQMGYGRCEYTYNNKIEVYGTGEVRPKGWPVLVQNHLGVGVFWLWCWWNGWSYGNQIETAVLNKNGDIIGWKKEKVSTMANKLANKHTRRR